jgi:hypothetical protein
MDQFIKDERDPRHEFMSVDELEKIDLGERI